MVRVVSGIQYDASVNSPSGGVNDRARSRSKRWSRTQGWKLTFCSTLGGALAHAGDFAGPRGRVQGTHAV